MAKTICMFNHKGGVSKTTTAFGLAWMLAEKGHTVVLVDADSQCNLSSIALGEDEFERLSVEEPERNIKAALAPAFEAKPIPLEPVELAELPARPGVLLLPGSFDLSEYEVSLGVSFTLTDTMSTLKNLPGSFAYLLGVTAEKYNADYVIVDMNPSMSAINEALFVSSDYFIVPTAPDNFSTMAVRSLAKVLPRWEQWAVRAREVLSDASYPLPNVKPRFLGTVVQRFNIRKGQPTQANQDAIDRLSGVVADELVPALATIGMTLDNYPMEGYCLVSIPEFHTLNAQYHEHGVPVFALTDEQLGRVGTVLAQYQETRARFQTLFSDFADLVIALTGNE